MATKRPALKCLGCDGWFEPDKDSNLIFPICNHCKERSAGQHNTGRTMWRAFLMVDLTDQGVGPFLTRKDRDHFFANMHHTHPHLVGKRLDCLEEPVSPRSDT